MKKESLNHYCEKVTQSISVLHSVIKKKLHGEIKGREKGESF